MPSSNEALFSGLPLSTWSEGVAFLIIIPLLFSNQLRSEWIGWISSWHQALKWILVILLPLVIIIKLFIFSANMDRGFQACYKVLSVEPPNGKCELSFENPTFRNQITRVDKTLFFNLNSWNLSFFNVIRYDSYGDDGNIERKKVPFQVQWSGNTSFSPKENLVIDYTGSAIIQIGDQHLTLDPAYNEVKTVTMSVPSGIVPVQISYSFNNHNSNGEPVTGPAAIFRVNVVQNSHILGPLTAAGLPLPWNLAQLLCDGILLGFLGSVAAYYGKLIFPAWRGLLFFSILAVLIWWGLPELLFMPVITLAFAWLILWQGNHKLLLGLLTLSILLWFRVLIYLPDPSYSLIRFDGTDMLSYESFAREILLTGSLRAGEDVFYYQALFRYVVFIFHILFGESDMLRSLLFLLALNFGIYVNVAYLHTKSSRHHFWLTQVGWLMLLLIVSLSNSSIVFLIQHGISETVSWILFLYIFYIYISTAEQLWLVAAIMLGLAITNRYNHFPSLGLLFLVFNIPLIKKKKGIVILSSLLIGLILSLIPLHNWVFGHQWIWMPTSADATANLILPPLKLLSFITNESVRLQVFNQFRFIAGFVSWSMLDMGLPIFILLVCWLGLGVLLVFKWKSFPSSKKWLWLVPGAFLGTQFFFYMLANFPRHLFGAYLAMALVGIFISWNITDTQPIP